MKTSKEIDAEIEMLGNNVVDSFRILINEYMYRTVRPETLVNSAFGC